MAAFPTNGFTWRSIAQGLEGVPASLLRCVERKLQKSSGCTPPGVLSNEPQASNSRAGAKIPMGQVLATGLFHHVAIAGALSKAFYNPSPCKSDTTASTSIPIICPLPYSSSLRYPSAFWRATPKVRSSSPTPAVAHHLTISAAREACVCLNCHTHCLAAHLSLAAQQV